MELNLGPWPWGLWILGSKFWSLGSRVCDTLKASSMAEAKVVDTTSLRERRGIGGKMIKEREKESERMWDRRGHVKK